MQHARIGRCYAFPWQRPMRTFCNLQFCESQLGSSFYFESPALKVRLTRSIFATALSRLRRAHVAHSPRALWHSCLSLNQVEYISTCSTICPVRLSDSISSAVDCGADGRWFKTSVERECLLFISGFQRVVAKIQRMNRT